MDNTYANDSFSVTPEATEEVESVLLILTGLDFKYYAVFQLDDRLVVGRRSDSDIVFVNDHETSRQHCQFVLFCGHVLLEDLGSTNGTWVNGTRIEAQELHGGETISIGGMTLRMTKVDMGSTEGHSEQTNEMSPRSDEIPELMTDELFEVDQGTKPSSKELLYLSP
ncbi:MAG: FHA domain-containing protein [Proteobacteria bacterium]|jgi:pSer/pThr/pTyr-binding forkhead associated (FHA) protein|nr:FHA domain-containing protein [Pseudomonadota bacterium]